MYRTVDDYEDVPRYRSWYSWHAWAWGPNRIASEDGSTDPYWPSDAKVALGVGLRDGEREREESRTEQYAVTFNSASGEQFNFEPQTESEFVTYHVGDAHKIRVSVLHGVEVLP